MNFEELVAGVGKHHGAFVAMVKGQKLLQVGNASRGAFAEWFRRQDRTVDIDGKGDYDAAYSQGLLDGTREGDVAKLVKKVLKQAPAFVFSVPTSLWRHADVRRTAADYERILSAYEVEAFPYWGGKMLCVVAKPVKAEVVKTEVVKTKPVKAEVAKTEPVKTEEAKTELIEAETNEIVPAEEMRNFSEWEKE